jgi:prepilin-type N-terminal cleavage/methylation domain-containing protein
MRNPRAPKGAFTLVELLVVISIIALLISILLPSLAGARDLAKAATCMSNLKRLGTSASIYLAENNGRFFPFRLKRAQPGGETYVNEWGRAKPRWQWFLSTGTGPPISPEPYEIPFGDGPENGTTIMDNNYFVCPNLRGPYLRDIRNGAYGYNWHYLGNSLTVDTPQGGGQMFANFPVSELRIKAPASTVIFGDSRGADSPHGRHSYTLDPPRLATEANATKFGPQAPRDGPIAHSPAEARHRDRAAMVFVDSHAEPLSLTALGYEIGEHGVVVPDFGEGTVARNRLWTGLGRDPLRFGTAR